MNHHGSENGESVVERLTADIANAIMVGEYPFGSWLRQETLAQRYGTSRQPVREALRRLEVIGMVQALPNRGSRVTGPDPRSVHDGFLIRAELEGLAARLAAERLSDDDLDDLAAAFATLRREIVRDFEAAGTIPDARSAWVAAHNRFHELIVDGAGNKRLAIMVRNLNVSLPRNVTVDAIESRDELEENIRQHDVILQSLQMRSPSVAAAAMEEHIRVSGELIAAWFARRQEDEGEVATPPDGERRRAGA